MADLSNILAALAAQRQGSTPQTAPPPPVPGASYPPPQYATPPGSAPPYGLPQPIHSGSVDLTNIKPVSSGSVSIADAVAKARGIAAEKGISYDPSRPPMNPSDLRTGRMNDAGTSAVTIESAPFLQEADVILLDDIEMIAHLGLTEEVKANQKFYLSTKVWISGSRTARTAAKAEIFRIIDDNEVVKRGQDKPRTNQTKVTSTKEGDSLQMMVPDRTVGLIIGRGGETIRDLQDRSGCHVNIVGENKSVNGMRPVNLIGSASAQQYARDLILEIVESDQKGISIKDLHREREDSHGKINDSIVVPGEAVGMIIGKGGESIRDMQNQTGCKINVSPAAGRDIEREIGLIGSRHAIDAAKRAIMEKVDVVRARTQARERESRDDYTDRYPGQQPVYPPAAGGIAQGVAPPPAAGEADPYAAYGGYQNYLQMWYAAMAAQQQGGQGQGEQR
ncbi:hypothetical protein AYO21_04919 [Fonsecaea monophora]|uniref:K Homology domain-containing protein n=1 Tax=Fonsecaea monophora TaxID=254056 RepID=A0A177FBN8_9EURO|nr:hypothetical protein AYO21_04919 [Fonsecaea monophora]OAG40842.1 hypothetical protein AYO21_04919 [Fonsecaea monophora]